MTNFLSNLPHMIMATVVIVCATVLASTHVITGGEAIGLIAGAGGFTLGAGAGSASASSANQTVATTSASIGTAATTTTPAAIADLHPATPVA